MTKFFQKSEKKTNKLLWGHFGPFLLKFGQLFAQTWAKMNFPEKRALSVFRYSNLKVRT